MRVDTVPQEPPARVRSADTAEIKPSRERKRPHISSVISVEEESLNKAMHDHRPLINDAKNALLDLDEEQSTTIPIIDLNEQMEDAELAPATQDRTTRWDEKTTTESLSPSTRQVQVRSARKRPLFTSQSPSLSNDSDADHTEEVQLLVSPFIRVHCFCLVHIYLL